LYEKSNQQHRHFEQQSKFLKVGKRIFDLIKRHRLDETNKELNEAVKKFVAIEKKRALQVKQAPVLDGKLKAPKIQKPVVKEILPKDFEEEEKVKSVQPMNVKVGLRVRIPGYTKTGVIQSIRGSHVEVLVGNFIVTIKIADLSEVEG